MAHMIDHTKGKAAFVSFQRPAWHGLGKIFTEPVTARQALEEGGLDFNVIKLPNIHTLPNPDNPAEFSQIISKDSFFTFRTDHNKILGSRLGKDYKVLQNIDALDIVDEILEAGTASIETAGAIDEGRLVFILLKVGKSILVNSNDEVKQYILIVTSHDGSRATTVLPTNVRVVCWNTLSAALRVTKGHNSMAIKIRHTENAKQRIGEAARVLKLLADNAEINASNYAQMLNTKISPETMTEYFYNVLCTPDQLAGLQAGNKDAIKTVKLNALKDVADFAMRGIGQKETLVGGLNMWTAYNAVTGYFTKKQYADVNDRAKSLLFGTAAEAIKDAGLLALTPAKIQPIKKQLIASLN